VLERGDEGKLDALALLVAGLGRGIAVLEAQPLVRVGLHPDRLDERHARPVVGIGRRAVVDREHALGPALDQVEAGVRGDRVEPGAKRASALEASQPAPGTQHRLLERVLGVVDRAEHPVAVGVQLAVVGLDQPAVGVLVAFAGRLEQLALLGGGAWGSSHRLGRLDRLRR
jgi:hypothetical protein